MSPHMPLPDWVHEALVAVLPTHAAGQRWFVVWRQEEGRFPFENRPL